MVNSPDRKSGDTDVTGCLTGWMLVMLTCAVLLVAGVVLAWRWRGFALILPHGGCDDSRSALAPASALVWILGVGLLTGLVVGMLIVGPAARLVMRLLAATSSDATGRLTEAGEVVGQVSVGGTIGLFLFLGLPFGLAVGVVYALASPVLPRGVLGGALFGTAVLVIFGSLADPLRPDNPDFDIIGPGWLSVAAFCALSVLTGILTVPIAGRIGATLPAPTWWWAAWMIPTCLIMVAAVLETVPVALIAVVCGCLVFYAAVLIVRVKPDAYRRRSRRALQAALVVLVAIALPGFVTALSDIAS